MAKSVKPACDIGNAEKEEKKKKKVFSREQVEGSIVRVLIENFSNTSNKKRKKAFPDTEKRE
jgi:hypothetical protein